MNREVSERLDGLVDLDRRSVLKGMAAGSMAGLALPTAGAGGGVEITVEQNGREVATVSPITTDRTVEDFYRYDRIDGASANTPLDLRESGASKLFFYRQSGGGPVSLVIIHDTVDDGSGGDVRFDFQPSLPGDGGWAVQDDPGEGFGHGYADWGWAPCCTDGGAYRGGFEDGFEVTVDPSFNDGIGQWDLLGGDGAVAAELSTGSPVTLTIGSGIPEDVDALADEKLGLAGRIDDNSQGLLNDRAKVEPVVSELVDVAESDEGADRATVRQALKRLVAGERITDAVLAGAGPGSSPFLDVDTNISKLTVQYAVNPILEIVFAGISVVKAARLIPGLGGLVDDAASWLGRVIADIAGRFSTTLEALIRSRARDAGLAVFGGAEAATKRKGKQISAEKFREVRDEQGTPFIEDSSAVIFSDMLFNEDRDFAGNETEPLDVSLDDLVDGLDADPSVDVDGDTGDALDAAAATVDEVEADYELLDRQLSESLTALFLENAGILEGVLIMVAVVAGVTGATVWGLPIAGIAAAAGALVGIGAAALSLSQWGLGTAGILEQRYTHQLAVDRVLDPSGG